MLGGGGGGVIGVAYKEPSARNEAVGREAPLT